jgi:hypothetical protein
MKTEVSYVYEIKHIPTGKVYVGSRKLPKKCKSIEEDKYMGSSSNKLFSKDVIRDNRIDYVKTILKTFDNYNDAYVYENSTLIPHYLDTHKKLCVNKAVILSDGDVKYIRPNLGRKLSQEWKDNIGNSHKGKKTSLETRLKMSISAYERERVLTEEGKKAMAENGRKNIKQALKHKVICEHCDKEMNKAVYSRFHKNDRCKLSPNVDTEFWKKIKQTASKAAKASHKDKT